MASQSILPSHVKTARKRMRTTRTKSVLCDGRRWRCTGFSIRQVSHCHKKTTSAVVQQMLSLKKHVLFCGALLFSRNVFDTKRFPNPVFNRRSPGVINAIAIIAQISMQHSHTETTYRQKIRTCQTIAWYHFSVYNSVLFFGKSLSW